MERCALVVTIVSGNFDQDVVRSSLGVLDENIKVLILVEYTGVGDLVFGLSPTPSTILLNKVRVWELSLRILV